MGKSKLQALGFAVEREALGFLKTQGLTLLEQNYSCPFGEIDLIMQDQEILVFVEVRYRKSSAYGSAVETIHYQKQQRIICTAIYFMKKKRCLDKVPCRFDVIGVDANKKMEWIANAFSSDG